MSEFSPAEITKLDDLRLTTELLVTIAGYSYPFQLNRTKINNLPLFLAGECPANQTPMHASHRLLLNCGAEEVVREMNLSGAGVEIGYQPAHYRQAGFHPATLQRETAFFVVHCCVDGEEIDDVVQIKSPQDADEGFEVARFQAKLRNQTRENVEVFNTIDRDEVRQLLEVNALLLRSYVQT